jgi:hypothetical protein
LIGIDIFFDQNLKPYFFEANSFPHLSHFISYKDSDGSRKKIYSKVHYYAKSLFIGDALRIVSSGNDKDNQEVLIKRKERI